MLDAVEEGLRDHDARALDLMVRSENEKARALYARRGFTETPRLVMSKALGPAAAGDR
ncbi:MAG: hypothetical protein GX607_00875 [Myxococcales bacterium]|nr:hypothetical protein [Myxococcales bacterium]